MDSWTWIKRLDKRLAAGWTAIGLSTLITCVWAIWGIIENFHEGWYYESLLTNVGVMFIQYLAPMLIFLGLTLTSLHSPRLGSAMHVIFAVGILGFFREFTITTTFLLFLPLIGLGLLYWVGRPAPRPLASHWLLGSHSLRS